MKKVLFVLLLLVTNSAFADDFSIYEKMVPDWYSGNKRIYIKFLSTCSMVRQYLETDIDCFNIKDVNEFNKCSMIISNYIASQRPPIKKIEEKRIEYKVHSPVAVASTRG